MARDPNSSEQALQDYFDALLQTEPVVAPSAAPAVVNSNVAPLSIASRPARTAIIRPFAEPIKTLNLRTPLPPLASESTPSPAAVVAPKPVEQTITIAPPVSPLATAIAPTTIDDTPDDIETTLADMAEPQDWLANGMPPWAQRKFECLLFKVGGLSLAAPLVELGSIYLLEEEMLTPIFGQLPWFLGLLPVKGYNVRTVDSARVVMPERYQDSMRAGYRYVISLHGSDWGLAVDAVENSIVLEPEAVRWRGQRSKRPWLAGTVVEHMCALLDVAQLAWMFHNQDRKRRARPPA